MFSTAQIDILNGLVAPMRDEGYIYYVAVTDNYKSNSYDPDLYIYFSKDEIFATDLQQYHIPSGSMLYSVRTSNGSNYNNTGPRIDASELELSEDLTVDEVEFVSTNATFTELVPVQPDYTIGEVGQYEMQGALLFVVCTFLLLFAFTKLFRRW